MSPKLPKPSEQAREFFSSVVPDQPNVKVKPMFGQLAAFVNGNMFMGLFGDAIILRLPEADRAAVTKAGGGPFDPMGGLPMKEYVMMPTAWLSQKRTLNKWIARSLDHTEEMPVKKPKSR